MPVVVVGDAAKSGPRDPLVVLAEDGSGLPATPAIAPAHNARARLFDPPGECECRICGAVFNANSWREYGFCADCKFEVGKIDLQAEVDAHLRFGDGGWDMYGSAADPNLDRGWLDGYKAARYDSMVEALKKERSRTTSPIAPAQGIRAAAESGSHSDATEPAPSPVAVISDAPNEEERSPTS